MKKLKPFLFVAMIGVLFITIFILWLQHDESLNDTTNELFAFQQGYQPDLKEHPYFIALGLDAKQDIDPMLLGRLRYHQYWAHYFTAPLSESDAQNSLELNIAQKFKGSGIDGHSKELLSNLSKNRDKGIDLELLAKSKQQLNLGFEKNQYLVQRYLNLIHQKNYRDLSLPANSALLDYSNMMNIHYLYISKLAMDRDADVLKSYIDQLILIYADTTSLIYKMLLNRMIDSSLTLLHFLVDDVDSHMSVMPMTDQQLSYRKVFAGELWFITTGLPSYENHIKNTSSHEEVIDNSSAIGLIGKSNLFFLPNMTINQFARQYQPYIELSESPYLKFKAEVNLIGKQEQDQQQLFKLKNYIGNILVNIGSPSFVDYIVRSRLLDHKIRVFNVLHGGKEWDLEQLNLNKDGYAFYQTQHELCIRSPYLKKIDWNQDSCLAIQ
ncbi:hypothetical protein [Acinetobacter haemolyticus]|uniref:hypothetical protein n=1 Tax=Acinetobacter haemolyticus TaxID=29430 RepID=UPI00137344A9|nr:hypothetical protein [Acinetobacter haemolyticus]NAR98732.1 hypothetical protein [Acinetobacter haemolyticus]